jgi:Ribbon-helix-helix protein, copG family
MMLSLGLMRTTVTLADDVAAELERLRRERSIGVSEALNELARAGMAQKKKPRKRFVQRTHDFGRNMIDVTNVAKALELAEGPDYR